MKNITFVIHELGLGGAERVATVLCQDFINRGYCVNIIRYTNRFNDYKIDGINKIYTLPYSRNKIIRVIKRIIAFLRICKMSKTEVIITLGIGDYMTYIYKKLNMGKLILSQRNDPKTEYLEKKFRKKAIKLFNNADKIVFQTDEASKYFSEEIQKKGIVIPNPIKNNLPNIYEGERIKKIVNFCRLEDQKNLPLLIEAFKEISSEYPEYRLEIYGRGSKEKELLMLIDTLGLDGKVIINDFKANIHDEIKNAMMFVSTSNYEGISNSMIEAMAIGLPVICTDCPAGGARMMIKNMENGILVKVNSKNEVVNAIRNVIENKELATKLSINAVKIKETLKSESICRRWVEII